MRKLRLHITLFAISLVALNVTGEAFAAILFEETFNKDASGNLSFERIVVSDPGPATIVLTNGTGTGFDGVKKGRVEVNAEVVYGGLDFKVTGTIFKRVALLAGNNALNITLSGPVGGEMTIQVIQGSDEPTLEFPAGTVFVSSSSISSQDTAGCGANREMPCKTIGFGISQGGVQTVVANGIYTENITLIDGKNLLGGYNPEFTIRDLATLRAVIRGNPDSAATVVAQNITSPTLLEGFVIFAPTRSENSGDSMGIHAQNSTSDLLIQNNVVFGGVAGDGADGNVGINGPIGFAGGNGLAVARKTTTDPDSGPYPGGTGGGSSIGASGGHGGTSILPVYNQPNGAGQSGAGIVGGAGGSPGYHRYTQAFSCNGAQMPTLGPTDATNGIAGANGANGVGGGLGGVTGVGAANAGGNGNAGSAGSGGGGGGAGGGADAHSSCDAYGPEVVYGPSGGGGGSGGGPGTGGAGGAGGGGSFGVYVNSIGQPTIGSNDIYLGIGGDGGRGGRGGVGGTGGAGGLGGPGDGQGDNGLAGHGGNGGNGGHGEGGGGGAGGLSVGIFANFDATGTYDVNNEIHAETGSAGKGGMGGFSLGNPGNDGQAGSVHPILFQP